MDNTGRPWYVFQFFCAPGTPVEPTRPPGQLQLLTQPVAAETARHRGGASRSHNRRRSRTTTLGRLLHLPRRPVTPPRGPPATSPTRRRKPRRKARSPPRHSDRGEDQAEPRTSAGPPTTGPTTGGQQVSQETPSITAQRVDEEFLHQLMTAAS